MDIETMCVTAEVYGEVSPLTISTEWESITAYGSGANPRMCGGRSFILPVV